MRSRNRSNNSIEFICYWEVYFFYASASEFGVLFSFTENFIRFGFKMCCSIMSDIFAINVCISWAPKTYVCLSTHEYACISHSRIRSSCLIHSRCFQCCRAFGGIIVLNAFFPSLQLIHTTHLRTSRKKNPSRFEPTLLCIFAAFGLGIDLLYSVLFCSTLLLPCVYMCASVLCVCLDILVRCAVCTFIRNVCVSLLNGWQ